MINEQIRDKEVRVIGEDGEMLGVMSPKDAMKLAKEAGVTNITYEEWLVSIKGDKGDPGAAGSKGEKGDPGNNGNDGKDGKDGATWLSGTTDPTNEGKNGDFYVNTTNWTIFKKENNVFMET